MAANNNKVRALMGGQIMQLGCRLSDQDVFLLNRKSNTGGEPLQFLFGFLLQLFLYFRKIHRQVQREPVKTKSSATSYKKNLMNYRN